jgi:hypothetical protein
MTQQLHGPHATSCAGCGAKLQTEDAARPGYLPESALNREPAVCQRCFRIKHYNEVTSVAVDHDDFLRLLTGIGQTKCLVVHIVDIFDFEGSLISGLQRFIGANPVVLAVNKMDLLPKNVNWNKILNWVQAQTKRAGLKAADIVLCSAKGNIGFDRLVETIGRHRSGRDVYVVGATNVGKSTMINRLIQDYSDLDAELTTSRYPGTTLDAIRIPLDDGKHIVDTPGIVYPYRLTEIAPRRSLQTILPDKPLKPVVYQLNEGQTLFFGALARFDFLRGERQSFTCYAANALKIHRTKLERANELYEEHKGGLLSPPSAAELDSLPRWTRHQFRIAPGARQDVAISGLGWIKVNGQAGALVDVYAPQGVRVVLRNSLIGS